mmetsp:Transcript_21265/g.43590  ORF Transcript_21265/g.43590 Transcript_21265/m.43590 type:complete len:96 (+) Transcript_21265:355-642(+)
MATRSFSKYLFDSEERITLCRCRDWQTAHPWQGWNRTAAAAVEQKISRRGDDTIVANNAQCTVATVCSTKAKPKPKAAGALHGRVNGVHVTGRSR